MVRLLETWKIILEKAISTDEEKLTCDHIDPFVHNGPFLYLLKTSANRRIKWVTESLQKFLKITEGYTAKLSENKKQ